MLSLGDSIMDIENDKPAQEASKRAKKEKYKIERFKKQEESMYEDDFCRVVSRSLPFLHRDAPKKIPGTMHSACKTRIAKGDSSKKICATLKFAAHAYSASLVQASLYELILRIEKVWENLKQVDISLGVVPPVVEDRRENIPNCNKVIGAARDLNRMIKLWSEDPDKKQYFHLLRINARIHNIWFGNLEWDEIQGMKEETPTKCVEKWKDSHSLALRIHTLQNVLIHCRNAKERNVPDPDREKYDLFIQDIIGHLDNVLRELKTIRDHIGEKHGRAYVKEFSPDNIPLADPKSIHPIFDRKVVGLMEGTSLWDLSPVS